MFDRLVLIKILVSAVSTLTMLFIFLLALRALIRKKCKPNLLVAGGMLVLCVLNWFFFNQTFFAGHALWNILSYVALIVALSIISLLGFFRKKTEKV